ncbi:MAG: hypothetical protein BYD32DRAFT_81739 [Podila humilis]|nr:MAG: hypothetical protein BYD32DRAFT_81739 [Podila humilis]
MRTILINFFPGYLVCLAHNPYLKPKNPLLFFLLSFLFFSFFSFFSPSLSSLLFFLFSFFSSLLPVYSLSSSLSIVQSCLSFSPSVLGLTRFLS